MVLCENDKVLDELQKPQTLNHYNPETNTNKSTELRKRTSISCE